ncbi:MAG: hypothetical protein EBZ77_17700, partial [Chitinophagia bacterium]|nr:hypothetical protein [Chitinophagia bacterium]
MLDTFICAGGTFTIHDTTINNFQSGNTFTVQLSDATGSFASPTTIGSATATSAGAITCTIPSGTAAGTGYRIRIVASNPAYISPVNQYNIAINTSLPSVTVNYSPVVCVNSFIAMSATAPYTINSYNWAGPASFSSTASAPVVGSLSSANSGIYTLTATHNGCPAVTTSFSVTVNTYIPPAPIDTVNFPICNRSNVYLYTTPTGTPGSYSYLWSGPAGFSSTLRNPVITAATLANAGTYYAYTVLNTCVSPAAPINVS